MAARFPVERLEGVTSCHGRFGVAAAVQHAPTIGVHGLEGALKPHGRVPKGGCFRATDFVVGRCGAILAACCARGLLRSGTALRTGAGRWRRESGEAGARACGRPWATAGSARRAQTASTGLADGALSDTGGR
jgi:hypothetical protein